MGFEEMKSAIYNAFLKHGEHAFHPCGSNGGSKVHHALDVASGTIWFSTKYYIMAGDTLEQFRDNLLVDTMKFTPAQD